ncbi:phage head morphogenesis protein [Clostridium botulinum]|nr:phage head morphogenesis protein [Clostridium botulinum]
MKLSDKQVQAFMEMLYKNGDKELKKLFEHQFKIKGAILDEIANIMLIYVVENDVMSLSLAEQKKEIQKLSGIINNYVKVDADMQIKIISNLLANTVNDTFKFYSYNAKKKDVEKILKESFKGKHFSDRVWDNENEVAKYLNKQIQDFIKGKASVNKIKKNIESTFNSGAYNAKRLTETEISRCQNSAFDKFGKEVEIKKVRRNEILDSKTCEECMSHDGEVWDFNNPNKPELPSHPCCRGYWDIVE